MVYGGGSWLDARPENDGKRWLSPFSDTSVEYIGKITEELSEAGFKHIICTNTMYPYFHKVDLSDYLRNLPLSDSAKRTEALWSVVDSAKTGAEKNGAKLWLEFSGANLISSKKSGTDAEIALDTKKLLTVGIIADYATPDASDAYGSALKFAQNLKTAASGAELSVMIKSGLSGAALTDTQKAFEEEGLTIYTET